MFVLVLFLLLFEISTAMPNDIFDLLRKSPIIKFMKTCSEINIAFIPYEEQVMIFDFFFTMVVGVVVLAICVFPVLTNP